MPITDIVHAASPAVKSKLVEHMAVNYMALTKLCSCVGPGMLKRQDGRIMFIGSTAAQLNPTGWESYTAAKVAT
jgi:short-subunit dehydrogenase